MSIVYREILNQFNFCFKIKDVREQGSSNRCNHYANKYFGRQSVSCNSLPKKIEVY